MNLKRIRHFIRLSETLNYSRTAKELGVSQPALTKSMIKLEEECGAQLLERDGRQTKLTQLGDIMLTHFRQIDRAAAMAEKAAANYIKGDMPQIRIGLLSTLGPGRIGRFVSSYRKDHPGTEIVCRTLNMTDLSAMLLARELDCAIALADQVVDPNLRATTLYTEDMVVAFAPGHGFAQEKKVALEDVLAQPYIDRLTCEFRDSYLEAATRAGIDISFAARSTSDTWTLSLVRDGVGVAIMPRDSVICYGNDILWRPVTKPKAKRDVALVVPAKMDDSKHLRRYLAALRRFQWADAKPDLPEGA